MSKVLTGGDLCSGGRVLQMASTLKALTQSGLRSHLQSSLWLKKGPETAAQITKHTRCSSTWEKSKNFSSAGISTVVILKDQCWLRVSYHGDHLNLMLFLSDVQANPDRYLFRKYPNMALHQNR